MWEELFSMQLFPEISFRVVFWLYFMNQLYTFAKLIIRRARELCHGMIFRGCCLHNLIQVLHSDHGDQPIIAKECSHFLRNSVEHHLVLLTKFSQISFIKYF